MQFSRKTLLILAIISGLFLITQIFFIPGAYMRSRLGQALQAPKVLWRALISRHQVVANLSDLSLENQGLLGQLAELKNAPSYTPAGEKTYIYARVYSSYPFNNADKLLINAGSNHGVTLGAVVFVQPGIFLGEVIKVNENTSEVRTLYDAGFEMPVKIGEGKIDALLVGGHDVKLTLISKKKSAQTGQVVLTAAKQYPYGLMLGTATDVRDASDNLFQEASLSTPYSISELNEVYVLKQ